MKLVHGIDNNGIFAGDFILRDITTQDKDGKLTTAYDVPDDPDGMADCAEIVTLHPPEGLQCPKWNGSAWVDAGFPYQRDDAGNLIEPEEE